MYARLLGIGAIYGFGFTLIKSLFPSPVLLLLLTEGPSTEGDLAVLGSVYIASGLIAGIIAGPLFGVLLLRRRGSGTNAGGFSAVQSAGADLWRALVLSLVFALLIGLISGLLTMGVGLGALLVTVTAAANAGVPADKAGLAAGLLNTSQQLGTALAIAVFSALATARTNDLLASGTAIPDAVTEGFDTRDLHHSPCGRGRPEGPGEGRTASF